MDILEVLGRIGFDWRVALFNIINFLIVAGLLYKFFFKKMWETMAERQRILTEGIENAERAKAELAMAEQKAAGIVKEAKGEANKIITASADEATKVASDIKANAEGEAAQLHERAKQTAEKEKAKMLSEFKQEAGELVVAATEKLVGTTVNKDASQKAAELVANLSSKQ